MKKSQPQKKVIYRTYYQVRFSSPGSLGKGVAIFDNLEDAKRCVKYIWRYVDDPEKIVTSDLDEILFF